MPKKLTIEEVKAEFEKRGYELLEDKYINAHTKMKFKCLNHPSEELFINFNNLKSGNGCRLCGLKSRVEKRTTTDDEFKKWIKENKSEFDILGKYINNHTKILVRHNICGYEWDVVPTSLKQNGCPECGKKKSKEKITCTHEEFVNKCKLKMPDYTVLGKYINNHTKILVRHDLCGREWEVDPSNFTGGHGCIKCSGKMKISHDEFINYCKKHIPDYTILGEYKNDRTKISIKHNVCGTIFDTRPNDIKSGNGCPFCKESKNEKQILELLNSENINIERQYKFTKCKNKKCLPFDFALLDESKNVIELIEADGKDHFQIVKRSKNEEKNEINFVKRQHLDSIKNQYCIDNKITLIRLDPKGNPYMIISNGEIEVFNPEYADIMIQNLNQN